MLHQLHKGLCPAKAIGRTFAILCVFIAAGGRTLASESSIQNSPNSSPRFNAVFAIADFDGDRKPDLATVEIQNSASSSTTYYSIRFRLTAGAAQSFGISAPAGGLQIVARDVNGDSSLDLLVTTAWLHQQVAVLLNDGHGNFTLAKPDAFPATVWESETLWESGTNRFCDSAALAGSQYSAGDFEANTQYQFLSSQPRPGVLSVSFGRTRLLLFSLLGRAPPA
jgi:hypothetical protein